MKLTLALGLQYDTGQRNLALLSEHQKEGGLHAEAVMTLPPAAPAPVSAVMPDLEFSKRYDLFFLTYTIHGLPEPLSQTGIQVSLFA